MIATLSHKLINTAVASLTLLGLTACQTQPPQPSSQSTVSSETSTQGQTVSQTQQPTSQPIPMMESPDMMGRRGMRGMGGWGHGGNYGRMYNTNTVETISGKVIGVDTFMPMGGMSHGMHLQLQTGNQTVDVHLGPSWYLEKQKIEIKPNETIEVKGSRITFAGKPAIIASQVKKGNEILNLRDEKGFPVWSGWRYRDNQN